MRPGLKEVKIIERLSLISMLTLLILCCSLLTPFPAISDERLDRIQHNIAVLETRESEYATALSHWKDIQSKLQTGNYLIMPIMLVDGKPFGEVPISRETFDRSIISCLLKGDEPKANVNTVNLVARYTREVAARAPGEIKYFESELEKTKNELAAALDERARIRQSLASYNPTRNCNWRECSCQWLAHTCTGGAITGTSRESCEKWGGNYWHTNGHCGKGRCSFSDVCPMPGHLCCM